MSYFSRITLLPGNHNKEQLAEILCADNYKEHQVLWTVFEDEPDAKRDFLFRRDDNFHGLRYFVVSKRKPENNHGGLWRIETKPYRPNLAKGQKLAFSLRVNPVVSKKTREGKSHRHDVVMDAKQQMNYKEMPWNERPQLMNIAQKAGTQWLLQRAKKSGFHLDESEVSVDSYSQNKSSKKGRQISFSTLDMSGFLEVSDTDCMMQALFNGIGPAKAFGCGLMLVRRI